MDQASDSPAPGAAQRSPGAILAAERERQSLARTDIAQRLHMSVSQVEALEAADYARLPRGTFLRGFTRNYARALGLDPEPLVGLLVEDAPRERSPGIVVPTQNIRFDPLGARLANPYVKAAGIAAAVIVLGFATMYWWLFVRPQGPAPARVVTGPAVEAPQGVPAAIARPEPAANEAAAQAQQAPGAAASPADTAPVPVPGTLPAPPESQPSAPESQSAAPPRAALPGEGTLRFTFRGAAWVEISDARGKMLLSRTHPGGSSAEVVGKPPFNVIIGNAPDVRLSYNGRDFDLAPHTRVAVARFTLQ
ncbi:MAG: DUF4115 domain-containing protein [Betaproteobacteria bacterium]|nr:DUF4115 domain-containing protein [Betaproteobacteria bacterium]